MAISTTLKANALKNAGVSELSQKYLSEGKTPEEATALANSTYATPQKPKEETGFFGGISSAIGSLKEGITDITKAGAGMIGAPQPVAPTTPAIKPPSAIPAAKPEEITAQAAPITLSPEEQSYYDANKNMYDAIASKQGQETAMKELQTQLKTSGEEKYAKDVADAMKYTQEQSARQEEMARIGYERDMKDAEANLGKMVQNANMFRGATGFPQTQAALAAQKGQQDRARQVISEMANIRELQKAGASAQLAKQMSDLQKELDINVSRSVQESVANLQSLIGSGKLDSVESIIKARGDLLNTLNTKYNDFLANTFEASKFVLEQAQNNLDMAAKKQEYNDNITKQMGDGFIYNSLGTKMTDPNTNLPLKSPTVAGKPLTNSPIELSDGTLAFIYQNPDGSLRTEKLEGTQPLQLNPQSTAKYAELVSKGMMSIDDLRQIGLSRDDIGNIVGMVTPVEEAPKPTEHKSVILKDARGNDIPASFDATTGTYVVNGKQYTGEQIEASGIGSIAAPIDPNDVASFSINKRGRENLQCGELVNDYFVKVTGSRAGMGDTLESKLSAVKKIGESDGPSVGGVFVSNPLNNNVGHTGIVQSINADGSITVLEANAAGKKTGEPPVLKTYSAGQTNNMVFSQTPEPALTPIQKQQVDKGTFKPKTQLEEDAANAYLAKKEGATIEGPYTNKDLAVFGQVNQSKTVADKKQILSDAGYNYEDYLNFQTNVKDKEDKYKDLVGSYKNLLGSLGSGVSDADREIMMQNYYTGLYKDDPALIKEAIRDSLLKNQDYGKAISSFNETITNVSRLSNALSNYIKKGGDTGLLTGTAESISQKLGRTTDPDLAQVKAGLDILLAQYVKGQSGTGVSDKERAFLQGIMPSISNLSDLNGAKISAFAKSAKDSLTSVIKTPFIGREKIYDEVIAPNFQIKINTTKKEGRPDIVTIESGATPVTKNLDTKRVSEIMDKIKQLRSNTK